jgi:hypothetical protein
VSVAQVVTARQLPALASKTNPAAQPTQWPFGVSMQPMFWLAQLSWAHVTWASHACVSGFSTKPALHVAQLAPEPPTLQLRLRLSQALAMLPMPLQVADGTCVQRPFFSEKPGMQAPHAASAEAVAAVQLRLAAKQPRSVHVCTALQAPNFSVKPAWQVAQCAPAVLSGAQTRFCVAQL